MDHDGIVRRVISRSDFLDAAQRREIERELRAHVEDIVEEARAQGHDEATIAQIVEARFGRPQEVAAAFRTVYARERLILNVVRVGSLLLASLVAVGLVVGSVQSIFAICTATSLRSAFSQIARESVGFTRNYAGLLQLVFRRAPASNLPGETNFARRCALVLDGLWSFQSGSRTLSPTGSGLCFRRDGAPVSAHSHTVNMARRNCRTVVGCRHDSRLLLFRPRTRNASTVPLVGMARTDAFLQSAAADCPAL